MELSVAQQLLAKEVGSLVQRLRLWTPARWSAAAEPWETRAEGETRAAPGETRADLGRHLAQWFADRAADLEAHSHRSLPVLHPDLLIADQLAVTGDDLVRADPSDALCQDAVAHLLAHRFDLLGDEPPTSLGGAEALARGRAVCTATS